MNKLRHGVGALIVFAVLVGLFVIVQGGFEDGYGVTSGDTRDGLTLMESLEDINIISGLNKTVSGIDNLKTPTGSSSDIGGAILSTGIGFLQLVLGLITFVPEIIVVVGRFYYVPSIILIGLNVLIISYVIFILVSAYLRGDI